MNEEQLTKMLEQLDDEELSRMADNLKRLALFAAKTELQKCLARKIAKFERSLERVEKWQQTPGIRKSVVGQDDEGDNDLWPSLNLIL
jgi:hypothetical protein